MALSVEEIIRSKGVVPATIALKGDKVHVGLDNGILTELAQSENCKKLTTRDLPKFLADGQKNPNQFGATTVASTMHVSKNIEYKKMTLIYFCRIGEKCDLMVNSSTLRFQTWPVLKHL